MMRSRRQSPALILVVEENVHVRAIAAVILECAKYRVIEARNVRQALGLLCAFSDVQVVFMGCSTPIARDEISFIRLVQKESPAIRVLMTSKNVYPNSKSLPLGVNFIAQPYRQSVLIDNIQNLLGDRTT